MLAAVLALAAFLTAPASAGAAKTKVHPATTDSFLTVRGSHGWVIQISGLRVGRKSKEQSVGVQAKGPHHERVSYDASGGQVEPDGSMRIKLPGLGRIDVHYEATSQNKVHVETAKNCTSAPTTVDSQGIFRGTIELYGEGGYTTVDRQSGRGMVFTSPKQTCRVRSRARQHQPSSSSAEELGFETLFAERKIGAATLSFTASSWETHLRGLPPHIVELTAAYDQFHDGMWIHASTEVEGKPEELSVSPSTGMPSEATVTPPAPFKGSAAFKLESPTTASWTGDLSAEIPTLGAVDLTGPGFWSVLCSGVTCTETAPPGMTFQLLGSD